MAAADVASEGAGIGDPNEWYQQPYDYGCYRLLQDRHSLCKDVHPSRTVVLPKQHTPRPGMTIRSLSHNLALVPGGEVTVHWPVIGWTPIPGETRRAPVNLLLVPFPHSVVPTDFAVSERQRQNPMADGYGMFTCDVRRGPQRDFDFDRLVDLFKRARDRVGRIDAIVFPELSLRPGEAERIVEMTGTAVLAGVGEATDREDLNYVQVRIPVVVRGFDLTWNQYKHHRWKLDRGQIERYGLSNQLDPTREHWESMTIKQRELYFWTGYPAADMTACVLICEDLARQEPMADIVRAVGPNLVVALLMDGPQLRDRWSARYAAILAEDPGSSVLAFTSIGMATLSKLPDKPPSRVVALWNDAKKGPREISLSPGAQGIILMLDQVVDEEEWTADVRSDGGVTGFFVYGGIHEL
jgi:hypothetical protein